VNSVTKIDNVKQDFTSQPFCSIDQDTTRLPELKCSIAQLLGVQVKHSLGFLQGTHLNDGVCGMFCTERRISVNGGGDPQGVTESILGGS
jgi:hypothetical protein